MILNRVTLLSCCLLLVFTHGMAQENSSKGQPMNLATALRKTVGFITVNYLKDGQPWAAKGTCFFAAIPDERLGQDRGYVYLVTNRHVAEPGVEDGHPFRVKSASVRLNLKSPINGRTSEEDEIPLGTALHWYFPADGAVDLAVLPIAPNQAKFDYQVVPLSLFATSDVLESRQIAEGDRVLFAGFFYSFPGIVRMEPIVREGILAMVPAEKLETTLHKSGHLYLADVHAFGGNSGSPLFVDVGGVRNGTLTVGGFPYLLLGVVSGYFSEDESFKLTVSTTLSGKVPENSGISTVVPADDLKALLESPELQAVRDSQYLHASPSN